MGCLSAFWHGKSTLCTALHALCFGNELRGCKRRDALDMVEGNLPSLVNALSEKDHYTLRRILRSLSHITSRTEAALQGMR